MAKEEILEFQGEVTEVLPKAMFKVKLDNDHEIIAHLSGKMRTNRINVVLADKVSVQVSPYDISMGRISYRYK